MSIGAAEKEKEEPEKCISCWSSLGVWTYRGSWIDDIVGRVVLMMFLSLLADILWEWTVACHWTVNVILGTIIMKVLYFLGFFAHGVGMSEWSSVTVIPVWAALTRFYWFPCVQYIFPDLYLRINGKY